MKKLFAALLIIILPSLLYGQYTIPQYTGATASSGGGSNTLTVNQAVCASSATSAGCTTELATCGAGTVITTCVVPIALTSGHSYLIFVWPANNVTLSSTDNGGAFTHCTGCAIGGGSSGYMDGGYIASAATQASPITLTMSGAHGGMEAMVYDLTCSSGTFTPGTVATVTGVSGSPFSGSSPTLAFNPSSIFHAVTSDVNVTAANSPWSSNYQYVQGVAASYDLNAASAPTTISYTAAGNTSGYDLGWSIACH